MRFGPLKAIYAGQFDPLFPCRIAESRHCPAIYEAVCGERPCARYESEDETPWLPETESPDETLKP